VELQEQNKISCFTRVNDDTVICPMGQVLAKLKVKGNNTIYGSKEACRQCNNRCTSSSSFKTVSFGPNTDCIPVKMYGVADELQPIPDNARISSYKRAVISVSIDRLNPFKGHTDKLLKRISSTIPCASTIGTTRMKSRNCWN